jgi:hypothetical protein
MAESDWLGVDLDGTLAEYHEWVGPENIGTPIPKMVERVKKWLREGKIVKIMTARVHPMEKDRDKCLVAINEWVIKNIG